MKFKLSFVLLILIMACVLSLYQILELKEWISDMGAIAFWYKKQEIASWFVLVGTIGGLFIRKRTGWILMLFFLYFNAILVTDMYITFFGSDLRFLPIVFTILLVLIIALIYANSNDLKEVYQVQTDTKKQIKVNLITFFSAFILAFVTSLLNLI